LAYFNIAHAGKRVLVLGAGGAAAAIGASLVSGPHPVAGLTFYDPTPGKASTITTRLSVSSATQSGKPAVQAVATSDPAGFDLVINASPLGMAPGDPLPCDISRLEPHAALVDIVMKNQPTPLVLAARARGLNAQPGFEMLIQQAHLYLDFFGMTQAAAAVRQDATALRERIYPPKLHGEIRHNR
jgi:shikimate dehydrogenase